MAAPKFPAVGLRLLPPVIGSLQIADLALHAATHQLEVLRVTANVIILLWLAAAAIGWLNKVWLPAAVVSVGVYLVLNLVFLAQAGLTNPAQGGAPRIALFVFIALTLALSLWLATARRRTDR